MIPGPDKKICLRAKPALAVRLLTAISRTRSASLRVSDAPPFRRLAHVARHDRADIFRPGIISPTNAAMRGAVASRSSRDRGEGEAHPPPAPKGDARQRVYKGWLALGTP